MASIQDILNQARVPYQEAGHRHVGAGWIGIDCPYCGDQSQFHLGINLDGKYSVCWRCGPHPLGKVLMKITRQPWTVVGKWLDSFLSDPASRPAGVSTGGRLLIPPGTGPLRRPHISFLKQRGFDPVELVRFWGIEGIGMSAKYSWSIWIPIYQRGVVVSWITRTIGTGRPKYNGASVSEESTNKKTILYGADYAGPSVVVVEGPTDVWAVGRGAVATLGLQYTSHQVQAIGRYGRRTICFDATRDAQKQAERLALELQAFPGQTDVVKLESGEDPAEADSGEIEELRSYLN